MMNGPCSLHPYSFIERAAQTVEAVIADSPLALNATRKTVFQRYCNDMAVTGETVVYYEETEDLLVMAQKCAATILSNQCPMYVVADPVKLGNPRVVPRKTIEEYPTRYKQIIN